MNFDEVKERIDLAWLTESDLHRLGILPPMERDLVEELTPPGGHWDCGFADGCAHLSILYDGFVVATINPNGELANEIEGDIAMGIRASPILEKALRCITLLAGNPNNLELICRIARTAVAAAQLPAPHREVGQE